MAGGASEVLCVAVHMDGPACEIGHGHPPLGLRSGGRYAASRDRPLSRPPRPAGE